MSNPGPNTQSTQNLVPVNVALDASGNPTGRVTANGQNTLIVQYNPATGQLERWDAASGTYVATGGGLHQKSVWYRLRHKSGTTLVDAMGNGPDIPVVAVAGTPNLWTTAKMASPPNDGTGKATTYARSIGNAYLQELCSIEKLISSHGLLFFAADIYPQAAGATVDKTQTIFQMGAGTGGTTHPQAFAFTQHTGTGVGRTRLNDQFNPVYSSNNVFIAETASTLLATSPGATRSALCGYIDMLNMTVGVSVNGGAFVTASITPTANGVFLWSDAEMFADGFQLFAVVPVNARTGTAPTNFMGGSAATLGTKCSGVFITRFDTHPGLDFIDQLATSFYDTVGNFPQDLQTGKY